MNREVEERIVKMYFDNKDFEKNAKTTIDTLDELKNGLKMDESAKGLQIFEKIGKTLDFSNSTKGLTKLKTGLKSMEGVLGKMFKIGEEPVREAEHVVGQIRSMFTRVIGYDIAGRMVSSIENAIRSLTIAPISAGWTQYEQKMDNVKTIMSSTGESIEVVQKHLTSLTDYANKTIYSLGDMTSNLGKFTNNGMKLEDSVKAMQGIANAAADAGQGAQQASMAMYNFSQAMGVGKMTTIDWKSIENANMATTRLKNTFIEMAAANGDLQKEFDETDKKYHYYITKDSKGQALKDKKKWTEVTISNFRETLSKDWLTAQSMMRALMVYSGEQIDPDTLKSWGITDPDEIKNLEKIGKDALEAATQVRTFTKMMDALRESVQSGWADSFELIFGNMPQGTDFWRDLNNELGEILDKSKEIRNNVLKIWSGNYVDTTKQEEELSEKNELLKQAQERLEKLIESEDLDKNDAKIKRYLELIEINSQKLAELKADNKGGKNNVKIKNLQATIDDYKKKSKELQKLNEDLAKKIEKREKTQTEIDAVQGQIDLYKSEIAGLRNTLSYTTDPDKYNKQLKNITEKERAMAKLQKKLDELKKAQDSDELLKTKKEVEALMKEVEELNNEIDEANKKPKSSIIDEQGRTGREILIDSIKDIIALAKELGGTFSDAFHNVFGTMDAQKLFDLTKAFENAVLNVKNWLHEGKAGETRIDKIRKILEGVFSVIKIGFNVLKAGFNLVKRIAKPVLEFLIDKFAKVGEFFSSLTNLSPEEAFQKIGDKLKETWNKIKRFFTPQDVYDDKGFKTNMKEIPAITWLKNVWNGLKTIIRQWANDAGIGGVYDTIASWWENIKKGFEEGFATVKNWWNTDPIVQSVKKFLQGIYDEVVSWFTPKTGYRYVGSMKEEYTEDMPIVAFFKNFYKGIEDAFKQVENWWNTDPTVQSVKKFLQGIYDEVASWFIPKTGYRYVGSMKEEYTEDMPIVAFFKNFYKGIEDAFEQIENWWNTDPTVQSVKKFLKGLYDEVVSWFTPKTGYRYVGSMKEEYTEDMPIVAFFKNFYKGIEDAFKQIENWWNTDPTVQSVKKFLQGIYDEVASWFIPKTGYRYVGSMKEEYTEDMPIVAFFKNFYKGIEDAFNQVENWWNTDPTVQSVKEFLKGIYEEVAGWFMPKTGYRYVGSMKEEYIEDMPIVAFFKNFYKGIEDAFEQIENWWNTDPTVQSVKKFLQGIYDEVVSWFTPKTGYRYVGSMKEEYTEDMPVVAFFKNFYKGIEDAFGQVENWWNTDPNVQQVKSIFSEIVSMVSGWFVDEEGKFLAENSPIVKFFVDVGDKIKAAWETLKTVVPWEEIGQFLSDTWNWIMKIIGFDGGESEDESEVKGANTSARRLTAAAGMSSITYAVNEVTKGASDITEGDAETVEKKVSLFKRIIGAFTDFFNAIGEAASSIANSPELRKFLEALGEFFMGLVSVLTKVLEFLGRFMNGNATVEDSILLVLGVVLTALIEGISMWRTANLANIAGSTQSIGLQFLEIAAGLMLVASAVSLLTAIDESKMATASVYIALLGGIIATIIAAIGSVASAASATTRTPVERVLTNLVNRIAMVGALYIIIKELPTIIQAIGEAKKQGVDSVGEDVLKMAEGIAILFGAVSLSFSLMNTLMPKGMDPIAAIKTALSISGVVAVMVTIFNVIGTIPRLIGKITGTGEEESVADTVANLNAFGEIMGALGGALGNFFGSIIGAFSGGMAKGEILSQFSTIKDGATIAGTISEEDLTAFTRLMSIMQNLNKSIPDYTLLQKWVNGNKLSDFAKQLPDLGAGLRGMADYLSGIGDEDMEKIREGAKFISYFANAMSIMASILGGEIGRVNAMVPNNFVLQQYIDAAEQLSEAVKKGLMDGQGNITGLEFNAMPIVEAICKALEQGEYAIAKAVKAMVNAGLQDIDDGDYTSYNALKVPDEVVTYYEQLSGKLRTNSGEVIDLNALIKDAIGDESEYAQLMAQIDKKTDELSSKISGMSNVFDDLNLTKVKTIDLDTGEEVETSWLEILQNQMAELSTTLDETPLEVKITPVFDFSNLEPETLQSEFSRQLFSHPLLAKTIFENPTESVDFVQIAADLGINDIKDKLNLILAAITLADTNNGTAIGNLGVNINGISNAISGMNLVLDTGVLVGQITPMIDVALAQRSDVYERAGVVFTKF